MDIKKLVLTKQLSQEINMLNNIVIIFALRFSLKTNLVELH